MPDALSDTAPLNIDPMARMVELVTQMQARVEEHHQAVQARRAGMSSCSGLARQAMDGATGWKDLALHVADLASKFARHGADLGFVFAYHGLDLGYLFASRGEAVGPMANRVLFMAVQIGAMADRIGEMADRILFMADKIGEFGDKILYESQLIVYSEQLIINESVLVQHGMRQLLEAITDLAAIQADNTAYFEAKKDVVAPQPYALIYDNMNLMLRNMHEFSLELLKKEAADRERELKVLEHQLRLREQTVSVNACYCPGFHADAAPECPPGDPAPIPPQPEVPSTHQGASDPAAHHDHNAPLPDRQRPGAAASSVGSVEPHQRR